MNHALLRKLPAWMLAASLLTMGQIGAASAASDPAANPPSVAPGRTALSDIARAGDPVPEEAQKLIAAVDGQIASQPPVRIPGIAFSPAAAESDQIPWLKSEGFVLRGSSLYRYHDVGAAGESQAAGRLDYADNLGRNVGFLWVVHYRRTANGRTVEHLTLAPAFEPRPRIHLALIPVTALPSGELPALGTYADLAQVVALYGLRPNEVPSKKADYFIVLSSLDPISTTAKLDLRISPKATGTDGEDSGAAHALINSWGLTVLRGTLDFSRSRDLYAKAVFTPGHEVGSAPRTPALIGVFRLTPGA